MAGVVAIVGRANVGKSTIFNRMVVERISIVEDVAGVTRDRIYAKASWLTKEFSVIDTGGIELENASFTTQIKMQAEIAIEEADVIVFVVNGRDGITKEDEYVARLLQKSRKPIILVVNKIDDNQFRDYIYEFYALGVGDPIPVSGSHGIGIGDLLDQIINQLEQNKRGIYGGAIGYLDFTGNMDLCIGIRLAYKRNNEISICSGAGIVYDSVPENEYQECLNKAGAVVEAIKMADGGIDYDSTY